MEAGDALMKGVSSQHRGPPTCALDMVEARGALMKAATSQHGEPSA